MDISLKTLLRRLRLLPRRSGSDFERFSSACFDIFEELEITNPAQIAYIFATIEHETAGTFKPVVEAFWLSENWRKRNLRYYPWHGRGFIQLTWEHNYKKVDDHFDMRGKLLNDPDLMIRDYEFSLLVSIAGMKYGWYTGKNLDHYINDKTLDLRNDRRVVNGIDKAKHIANLSYKHLDLLHESFPVPKYGDGSEDHYV